MKENLPQMHSEAENISKNKIATRGLIYLIIYSLILFSVKLLQMEMKK